ncbi:uncharacterized protein UV8b_02129 [Ustilaginoidea virens]|uniref:Fatty acid desaturase domain-containing protein n=1 Tax=Ustilaginoidea virens TaxID=1159556 RepID=A0A8E5HM95_USTVR|nr:uncharacterized protein UV8b_02129 [Ustilaginoidea virens]QUC17888.1 hypothetical protein UV8b_02129 [Ustilaginoidea virens]
MEKHIFFDKALTKADRVVLKSLAQDIKTHPTRQTNRRRDGEFDLDSGLGSEESCSSSDEAPPSGCHIEANDVAALKASRDPKSASFQPTVLLSVDDCASHLHPLLDQYLLQPYIRQARKIVRHETDVAMLTHLIIYLTTSVPSALLLFRHFTYPHAILHFIMQMYYVGTYTLMQHQHIHQRGILAKQYGMIDKAFPYILDPLMGHTWNTYYYHHVKHHHVEGNGPDDLSSTIRYQRDSVPDFLHYVGRFFFLVSLDLPLYFLRKNKPGLAIRAAGSEFGTFAFYHFMSRLVGFNATLFVYLLPLLMLRLGLMVGNWGQHAFVDQDDPDSDFRSSITLVDVASNRFCFNDGYHTSHHLNPLRHWRDHPMSFLEQKSAYAQEGALVFHNIDFLMITFRLLRKDYEHLAKCLVPMGDQISLTMEGRVQLLKKLTRKFTEDEIAEKFKKSR